MRLLLVLVAQLLPLCLSALADDAFASGNHTGFHLGRRRRHAAEKRISREGLERVCFPLAGRDARLRNAGDRGQIGTHTSFGTALTTLASRPEVKRALEIGTWYGGGSTISIAQGIRDSARLTLAHALGISADEDNCIERDAGTGRERCCHSLLITVEVFREAWEHAVRRVHELPVWCILGSTVAADEMLKPSEIPDKSEHFHLYYQRDLRLMQRSEPQLALLCQKYRFQLVLIDGNEYTGWAEFNHVRRECKPKYLALHDTNTLKTSRIEAYLRDNHDEYTLLATKGIMPTSKPGCELVGCRPERTFMPNAAGWSIYQRNESAL